MTMKIPKHIDTGKRFKIIYEDTRFVGRVVDVVNNNLHFKKNDRTTKHCDDTDRTNTE